LTNTEPVIVCPKCKTEIKLTESLSAPMVERVRAEYEERLERSRQASEQLAQSVKARESLLEATIFNRVREREQELRDAAQREAAEGVRALNAEASDLRFKLAEAQQAQAEALRKERELEGRERAITLTIEQGITAGVRQAEERARREADDAGRLKRMELEATITSMQAKLAEAQQKAEQGSQQLQGEVQELDLEAALRAKFPFDTVEEVAKGVNGADITQTVVAPSGAECGFILWESKRTKRWSDGWLPKLREDGRKARADVLVIVSAALPEDVEQAGFSCLDNVWVCSPTGALSMALALRATLLAVHAAKQAQAGMATKAEEVYGYVTGPQFRRRVEALVEAFTTLNEDLVAEQKATQRQWAKRAVQLERVIASTSGMFGDLQGIAGKALPAPEGLALAEVGE
jgi:hypothetical protein